MSREDGGGTEAMEGVRLGLYGRGVGVTGGKLFGKGDVPKSTAHNGMYKGLRIILGWGEYKIQYQLEIKTIFFRKTYSRRGNIHLLIFVGFWFFGIGFSRVYHNLWFWDNMKYAGENFSQKLLHNWKVKEVLSKISCKV